MKKYLSLFIIGIFCVTQLFAQQKKHVELKQKLQSIISKYKANVGLSVIELETSDTFSINNQTPFTMQSVFKFPLALTVLHLAEKGKLNLDEKVLIKPAMWKQFGWSSLKTRYPGDSLFISIDSLVMYSISYSDNLSCDKLFEIIGGPKVANDFMHQKRCKNIQIKRTEILMNISREAMHENNSTPYEMSLLMKKFYDEKIIGKKYQEKLLHYMIANFTSNTRMKGALPNEIKVAHKTGTGSFDTTRIDACNDVGIIYLPNGNHLAVSIFVMNSKESYATTEKLIAILTKEIFEFYKLN
jgi:beta-lactamase class A